MGNNFRAHDYKFYNSKRGYIIYEPEHYNEYATSYTGGFVQDALTSASFGMSRYLGKARQLSNIGSNTKEGFTSIEDVKDLYSNMESIITNAWQQTGPAAITGSLSGIRPKMVSEIDQGKKTVQQLSAFTTDMDAALTEIFQNKELSKAYRIIYQHWKKGGTATLDSVSLDEEDVEFLGKLCSSLNVLGERYSEVLAKSPSTGAATKSLAKLLHLQLGVIFGAIGEKVSKEDVEKFISQKVDLTMNGVQTSIMKLDPNQKSMNIGSKKSDNKTVKPDLVTPLLTVTTTDGTDGLSFETKISASVKNYPSLHGVSLDKLSKKWIKIYEQNSIIDSLNAMSPTMKQYAANVLTHDWTQATKAGKQVRYGLGARFFGEWLAGMGGRIQGTEEVNISNFMLVNGRLYAMTDIIAAVQKQYNAKNAEKLESVIKVSISRGDSGRSKVDNKYVKGESKRPNYIDGFTRSNTVWGQLADLQLIAYIRPQVFVDIAIKKYGVAGTQVF